MQAAEKEFEVPLDMDEPEVELPLLAVRDTIVFPRMLTPLFVGRKRSILALEAAMAENNQIVVVTQHDPDIEDPDEDDLYTIGTEATVGRMLKMPEGGTNILVQGYQRIELIEFTQHNPYPGLGCAG